MPIDKTLDDWQIIKLGEICQIIRGASPRPKGDPRYFGGKTPWIKISDVTKTPGKYIYSTKEFLTDEGRNKSVYLEPETLIVTNSATIGIPKILKVAGCIHDGFLALLKLSKEVDKDYLYYFILHIREHLIDIAPHGTQKNLNTGIAKAIEVPLPPLKIQKHIIATLDRVENLRILQEQANQLTRKTIQSVFLKMFGRNGFPKDQIRNHVMKTEVRDPRKKPNDYFKYVDIAGIDNKAGKIVEVKEISGSGAPSRARRVIRTDDVIVSTVRPNLNATAIVPSELDNQICSTGFCVLRCKSSINHLYLHTFTRRREFIDTLSAKMKGASYPAVTNDDVLDVEIAVPPIELQNKFSAFMQQIEKLSKMQEKSRHEINELFHSLMQRAFTERLVS